MKNWNIPRRRRRRRLEFELGKAQILYLSDSGGTNFLVTNGIKHKLGDSYGHGSHRRFCQYLVAKFL